MKILTEPEIETIRRTEEKHVMEIIVGEIKKYNSLSTIVEVGAHWGEFAFMYYKVSPESNYVGYDTWGGIRCFDEEMVKKYFKRMPNFKLINKNTKELTEFPKAELVSINNGFNLDLISHNFKLALSCLNTKGVILINHVNLPVVDKFIKEWHKNNKDYNLHIFDNEYKIGMVWKNE